MLDFKSTTALMECAPINGILIKICMFTSMILIPNESEIVGKAFIRGSLPGSMIYDALNGYVYITVNGPSIIVITPSTNTIRHGHCYGNVKTQWLVGVYY